MKLSKYVKAATKPILHKKSPMEKAISDGKEIVSFLHIGKNAGTQMNHIAQQINDCSEKIFIKKRSHGKRLIDLVESERYFFSIRKPTTRFASAFYSRKRKGQPRLNIEWSPQEETYFNEFEHANELAEALFEESPKGQLAFEAMQSIGHVNTFQADWFAPIGDFLMTRPPIMIIRQEQFQQDLDFLLSQINTPLTNLQIASDRKSAHKTDYTDTPELTKKALQNLEKWFIKDIYFYNYCVQWINKKTTL